MVTSHAFSAQTSRKVLVFGGDRVTGAMFARARATSTKRAYCFLRREEEMWVLFNSPTDIILARGNEENGYEIFSFPTEVGSQLEESGFVAKKIDDLLKGKQRHPMTRDAFDALIAAL
jgi:hypothetical protein